MGSAAQCRRGERVCGAGGLECLGGVLRTKFGEGGEAERGLGEGFGVSPSVPERVFEEAERVVRKVERRRAGIKANGSRIRMAIGRLARGER